MNDHEVTASEREPAGATTGIPARWTSALATLLLAVVVVIWVFGGLLSLQDPDEPIHLLDVVWVISFLVFPAVGWLIAVKLPNNRLGWIYLSFAVLAGVGAATEELAALQGHAGNYVAAAALIKAGGWLFSFAILLVLGPGVLLFPDGRLPGHRWRFVLWGTTALMFLSGVIGVFGGATACIEPIWEEGVFIECAQTVDNPLHLPIVERLSASLGPVVEPLLALAVVLSLVGLVVRYRRSAGDVRQQIKWVLFVAAVGIVPLILVSFARQVLGFTGFERFDTIQLMFFTIGLPVAIGIAIFKYRLYDIDRIISRTAAYAIVVGVLAAVFVGTVTLTQRLLPLDSQFGIVASTLVVAALFNPLRRRVRDTVDRRFNRSRYDAQRVLDEFSIGLQDGVDLELMQAALLSAADQTLQPSHLSLWIRERKSSRDEW